MTLTNLRGVLSAEILYVDRFHCPSPYGNVRNGRANHT